MVSWMNVRQPHLCVTVLVQPREHGEAEAKCKGVLRGRHDGHGLAGKWPVAVDDVGHAGGRNSTENGVADASADDGNHGGQVVLEASSPQHEPDRGRDRGRNEAP